MRILLATAAAFALAVPAAADHHKLADAEAFAATHAEAISGAVNHPSRADDRARDQFRHPAETLAFFRVEPDMKVGEYAPGGGWYTRVLGHYLGGEGQLVGLYSDPTGGAFNEEAQQRIRAGAAGFSAEAAEFTGLPTENFSAMTLDAVPEGEAGTLDRVLVVRMMHNLMRWNNADSELKTMRDLLKPGGMLGIVQHRAPADASAEDIQTEVYEIGKREEFGFESLRDWFKALYQTLLGSDQGPRMGSFIALYGVENTRKLIAETLSRT